MRTCPSNGDTDVYRCDSRMKYELTDRWTIEGILNIYNSFFKAVINTEFTSILKQIPLPGKF